MLLDDILEQHAAAVAQDIVAYRNHTYRVVNFGAAHKSDDPEWLEKLAIAAAFHDLGIWTDKTFDYLAPSERMARAWLAEQGREDWAAEIGAMIQQHHKITPYRNGPTELAEAFRKADWTDVSRGLLAFGIPRTFLREVFDTFPNAGFHRKLVQLSLRQLRSHPLNPLPMIRL